MNRSGDRKGHEDYEDAPGIVGVAVVAVIGLIIAAYLVMLHGLADGAPAPRKKSPPPPRTVERLSVRDMEGAWVLGWGGSDWRMHLAPGGAYDCVRPGTSYVGRWWPDAFGRLCVREAVFDPDTGQPGAWSEWTIHWAHVGGRLDPAKPSGEARYEGGSAVRVTLRRAKKGE